METQNTQMLESLLIRKLVTLVITLVLIITALALSVFVYLLESGNKQSSEAADNTQLNSSFSKESKVASPYWIPLPDSEMGAGKELIEYGKELVAHTSLYFGPMGSIRRNASNGMNCQNCHLDAGTRIFGNNYSAVASTYPKYRARSGSIENIPKRVNDCFERSLNGKAIDTSSREMQAIVAYIQWLGKNVPKGRKPEGSGLKDLKFLDRAADPVKGEIAYQAKCSSCHGKDGAGSLNPQKTGYTYPPLYGSHSYNNGAGLYRISNFAKFIKYNMPLGVTYENPALTDEEAWDIAAFVNSQNRPSKDISKDWPKISEKPFDHPFGPFSDGFSANQHKFGPYGPIKAKSTKK